MNGIATVTETNLAELGTLRRGKVRDVYDLNEHMLVVATDRLSAFDHILPDPIPGRGIVLTDISNFWFKMMRGIVPNHLSDDQKLLIDLCAKYPELSGRSMLVKKAIPLKIEAIVRGYLSGSGWKSYREDCTVCGIHLPTGLQESSELPDPIFTPSTKAEEGHDINISFDEACEIVGEGIAWKVKEKSLAIYKLARDHARKRGIIIGDTKLEFGICNGALILIDEVLTPDSSRFWPADDYAPGRSQKSYDKQIVRDYLISIGWEGQDGNIPRLPQEIIDRTRARYFEALEILAA